MKPNKIFLSMLLLTFLTYTSCTSDSVKTTTDGANVLASTLTTDEVNANLSVDLAMDDIAVIVNDQVEAKLVEAAATKNIPSTAAVPSAYTSILPSCAVSSFIDTAVTSGTTTTTTRTITITFGTASSACVFRGHNLQGQIILNHTYNSFTPATTKYIMVSFNNFSVNGNKVEGTATLKRDMIGSGTTLHPKYTFNIVNTTNAQTPVITPSAIKYTTSAGVYTRSGWFTKEAASSGYATRTVPADDSYSSDVAVVTLFPSQYVINTFTISVYNSPLVYNTSCGLATNDMSFAASGTLFMTKGTNSVHSAVIKYGTGACDNSARIAIDLKLNDYFAGVEQAVQYNSPLYLLIPAGTTPPSPAEIFTQVTAKFDAKFDSMATPFTLNNN